MNAPADIVEISLGAIDGDVPLVPDVHIYMGSKVNWFMPEDTLPKFYAGRASEPFKH